jgi:hypothetical protein
VHETSWVTGKTPRKGGRPTYPYSGTNSSAIFTDAIQWTVYHDKLYEYLKEWLALVNDRAITRIITVAKMVEATYTTRDPLDPDNITLVLDPFTGKPKADNRFKYPGFGRPKGLGKLGYKVEPAGKVRVFAMVDSLTQCVMSPVHDLLFAILKRIPTDGTFDQMKPAQRLVDLGFDRFWSLDLSSATDRFPLALEQTMMQVIIGPRLAELWARLLVERDYLTPRPPKGVKGPEADTPLRYGAGQPMGALTSWAAFSLTHHFLVQYAAYKSKRPLGFFKDYALLGDDIVIANADVALAYQALLLEIGVEYGLAKSLISSTGGFEFAKRTFSKGKDVSAISLLALGVAKADHAVLESVLVRFGAQSTLWVTLVKAAKVLGYGYKSIARLPAVLATKTRLQGLAILLSRPGSPWGLSVIDWLLQASPGIRKEVPKEVLLAIGERLWDSLKAKTEHALKVHQEGLKLVLNPDSTYGGNIDVWFDKDALHEHSWNVYVVVPLVAELKIELKTLKESLLSLERPTLDDLNEIWLRIEELRDAIAAIPVVPNFFERLAERTGGAKRSALIKVYRSVRSWLTKELAVAVTERCLPIKGMAMAVPEPSVPGTDVLPEVESSTGSDRKEGPGYEPGWELELHNAFGDRGSFGIHPSQRADGGESSKRDLSDYSGKISLPPFAGTGWGPEGIHPTDRRKDLESPTPPQIPVPSEVPVTSSEPKTPDGPQDPRPLGPSPLEILLAKMQSVSVGLNIDLSKVPSSFLQMNEAGDGIETKVVMTPSGYALHSEYIVIQRNTKEVVRFTETDVHFDGIHHREDAPYGLALRLFSPTVLKRVKERLQQESYDDLY